MAVVGITPLPDAAVYQRFNRQDGHHWFPTQGQAEPTAELAEQLEDAYLGTYDGRTPLVDAGAPGAMAQRYAPQAHRASRRDVTTAELEREAQVPPQLTPAEHGTWERATCADLEVGDRIARRRQAADLTTVRQIIAHERSAWVTLEDAQGRTDRIRPQHTTRFWRWVAA
jgi:hypothetical protein